ncbi:MAG TPA: alpha/beta hydrolase [Actinomycetota bacterium]|nr:alpha/beta hydrolase [Actinomycetota bacterium]
MRGARPRTARQKLLLLPVIATTVLAAGCGGRDTPSAPSEDSRAVSFAAPGGVRLAGRLFGEGRVGVVLSHMYPADQRSWWRFAERLAEDGYTALTFDFRGYCPGGVAGCSEGEKEIGRIWQDVVAAIEFLRSHGATTVVLMGASMGATASLIAAAQQGVGVSAIVSLSAPVSFEGLTATAEVLARVTAAKFFVAGVGDPNGAADAAEALYAQSPQPKRVEILPADDHGTDLLEGSQSGILQTKILDYLQVYAPA